MTLKSVLSSVVSSQQPAKTKQQSLKREAVSLARNLGSHALIISGIRRCGKSTLMHQLISSRTKKPFYINFDDPRLGDFDKKDWGRLDELITESGSKELFFDEIQIVDEWERYVRQKLDEKYPVFITGSNASLLSRELGTKLTGRHISTELFPFSYKEFLQFRKLSDSKENVMSYLKQGGFPEYLKTQNTEVLSHLMQDILYRDIAVRYGIRDVRTLQRITLYLISNVGNRISSSKLKNQFSMGSTSTITEYLSHLETSYLLFFVPKFSYSLKSQMVNPRKVYAIDTGLITANSGSFTDDYGSRFENMIYLQLRRKHKEIYYYADKKECDFVLFEKGKAKQLIQVCYSLTNDNLERETSGLVEAMKFFNLKQGTIVTLADDDKITKDGCNLHILSAKNFFKQF